MRFIDQRKLRFPDKWLNKAQDAYQKLSKVPPERRKRALNTKSGSKIWRALKHQLAELSESKCWYCETRQIRSDNAVDHFRPKLSVKECSDHPGYWWLAFDWQNYRYACDFCNSPHKDKRHNTRGGKHDHFPLVDENQRAKKPEDDWRKEKPLLLDPTVAWDTTLLTFYPDGQAVPTYPEDKNPLLHQRAKISIDIYHLNQVDIREARFNAYREAVKLIERGNDSFERYSTTNDDSALDELKEIADELQNKMSHKGEYSAAVRVALMSQCRGREWLASLINTG